MAKKQVSKKAKRRLIVFGPIAVFIIIYCAFTLCTTITDLYKLSSEEKSILIDILKIFISKKEREK